MEGKGQIGERLETEMAVKKVLKSSWKQMVVVLPETLTKGVKKKMGEICKCKIDGFFDKERSSKKQYVGGFQVS